MESQRAQTTLTEASARKAMIKACALTGQLEYQDAVLVRLGENALFASPSASVIVRVARSASRAEIVAKELAVARWLAQQGFPAVHPTQAAQPIEADGRLVTFWEYVANSSPPTSAAVLARLLRDFHALPDPDFPLPTLNPFPVMRRRLREVVGVKREDVCFLSAACDKAEIEFRALINSLPGSLIHGDAHRGNVLSDGHRAVLIDYEATAIGPRAWDLIPTALAVDRFGLPPEEYAVFSGTYGSDVTESRSYPILRTTRELGMTTWLMQIAQRGPAAAEFKVRLDSLRTGDLERRWHTL